MTRIRPLILPLLAALLLVGLTAAPLASQPSIDDVRAAAAAGVQWLVDNQLPDGRWPFGPTYDVGRTALACKKLMHHAVDDTWGLGLDSPFSDDYPFRENVERCVDWLLDHGAVVPIGPQPAGDPDTDGDGLGVSFGGLPGGDFPCFGGPPPPPNLTTPNLIYESGIMLMLLCEAVELDRVVGSGPLSGLTYEQVAEDLADFLYWSQNEGTAGTPQHRGGWRYCANSSTSDNSVTGWVSLGLGFAEAAPPIGCGFEIPQWVKAELEDWVDYITYDGPTDLSVPFNPLVEGCSGYDHPGMDIPNIFGWHNVLKGGHLLQELALLGKDSSTTEVQDGLVCLETFWPYLDQDPGWLGFGGSQDVNCQGVFNAMKGLTSQGITTFGAGPIDWAVDFETELLAVQQGDGSWVGCNWGDPVLCTSWCLLTLERAAPPPPVTTVPFDIHPTSCPNPFNCKGKGTMPAAILGTADLDVTQIDPASITVEGVAPVRWAYEDVATPYVPYTGKGDCLDCTTEGADGFLDLTLKFDMQAIRAALGDRDDGECVVVSLSGRFGEAFGGGAIGGEDVVRFQCRGGGR